MKYLCILCLYLSAFFFTGNFFAAIPDEQAALLKNLPADQRKSIMDKIGQSERLQEEIQESFKEESIVVRKPELLNIEDQDGYCSDCVYGFNLFRFSPSTFAPSNKVPVLANYTLGPGDKILLNYYGNQKTKVEEYISRDGSFNLPNLGPVNLAGLTFIEAKDLINEKVASELIGTEISISLSELRSITVYILGQAYKPGSYTLSALSTITNALFISGGINEQGSLRTIELKRNGRVVKTYDLYDLLLNGDISNDIRLEDGDSIFIPFLNNKISMKGAFKRPSVYEFIDGEDLQDAIRFSGGLNSYTTANSIIEVNRFNKINNAREIISSSLEESVSVLLNNGDLVTVNEILALRPSSVTLTGEFLRPGVYSVLNDETILDIINRAGGYTDQAYSEGAIFTRDSVAKQQKEAFIRTADSLEQTIVNIVTEAAVELNEFSLLPLSQLITKLRETEPLGRQVVDVDYLNIKTDPYNNFVLRNKDRLHVPKRPESINVAGEVLNAATLRYKPGLKVYDYINLAGGLSDQSDKSKIFLIAPNGQSVPLKKGLFGKDTILIPGTTIVVSRDSKPFDAIKITQIVMPILSDLATSAAAIAAISNN
jgi:protein involved in polysaccharide export with SLBB domain